MAGDSTGECARSPSPPLSKFDCDRRKTEENSSLAEDDDDEDRDDNELSVLSARSVCLARLLGNRRATVARTRRRHTRYRSRSSPARPSALGPPFSPPRGIMLKVRKLAPVGVGGRGRSFGLSAGGLKLSFVFFFRAGNSSPRHRLRRLGRHPTLTHTLTPRRGRPRLPHARA